MTEDLIARCIAGDEQSWEKLITTYAGLIYGVAARYGLSEDDRADVFQRVSIELWRSLGKVRQQELLPAWLCRVTGRISWKQLQEQRETRKQLGHEPEMETLAARDRSPEEIALLNERWRGLSRAIQELDPPCRGLVRALFFDPAKPSYVSVAERLAIPKNSLGPTRQRCLGKLRRVIEDASWEPEALPVR